MMESFGKYKRKNVAEMRTYVEGEDISGVSISKPDEDNGSPKLGDMIARNPKNHNDKWLVSEDYFKDNFEPEIGIVGRDAGGRNIYSSEAG